MSLSMKIAMDILKSGDYEQIRNDLGFITTVLRDNASNDAMRDYYQAVIDLMVSRMDKED